MYEKEALELHKKHSGKLEVASKIPINQSTLKLAYTPGVAEVSKAIAKDISLAYTYTMKSNSVAIVTNGTAVLGLGKIGPQAALPVMEGKAILFKKFANIDAFPICMQSQDASEIISVIKTISPTFGGINLEDIVAPACFDIENSLQDIGIPVFHDDQHGTAVVVRAALQNACRVLGKVFPALKVIINGAGAAGIAIAKILVCDKYELKICNGVREVIVVDTQGAIHKGRHDLSDYKKQISLVTNQQNAQGPLEEVIKGADVFIGVSRGGALNPAFITSMASNPIIFALANPVPEIMPDEAKKAGARIIATGRSDFPNQVNNVLAFPGLFRGALDSKAKRITPSMFLHAADALARTVKKPSATNILPSVFDKSIVPAIALAVRECVK